MNDRQRGCLIYYVILFALTGLFFVACTEPTPSSGRRLSHHFFTDPPSGPESPTDPESVPRIPRDPTSTFNLATVPQLWSWAKAGELNEAGWPTNLVLSRDRVTFEPPTGRYIWEVTDSSNHERNWFKGTKVSEFGWCPFEEKPGIGVGTYYYWTTHVRYQESYSVHYVHETDMVCTGDFSLIAVWSNTRSSGNRQLFGSTSPNAAKVNQHTSSGALSMTVDGQLLSLGNVLRGTHVLEIRRENGVVIALANGTEIGRDACTKTLTMNGFGYSVDGGSSQFDDWLWELAYFNGLPDANTRTEILNYFTSKWIK